jgi:2-oxoisovalerate dehydrogenase E1 component
MASSTAHPVPAAPPAIRSDLQRTAMLIRAVEQRLLALFGEGRLFGTVHTCIGQEWTGIAVAEALREGDVVFSNHRCHGHFLARTGDVDGLIAEVMGRTSGICGGRGGSQHVCSRGFYSNGVQGGIVPVAAGMAWAARLRRDGAIAVAFIGDGTLGQGAVYETFNIASKWDLPLLIVLENNRYAQSTPQSLTLAGGIDARPAAFGIRTFAADTWHPDALLATVAEAADHVRRQSRPAFVRIDTYRLMAHSKGDDDRDPAEVRAQWETDPVTRFEADHPGIAAGLRESVTAQVEEAVRRADAVPFATAGGGLSGAAFAPVRWSTTRVTEPDRVVNRIHAALRRQLAADDRTVLLGEDIEGPYGGAFKVTKDLSREFPGRVRGTPISEAAIVGLGNGLALAGMLPVCEIMFGDFITLAADQWINHAAKFRYMYAEQVRVPLVVRTPMGGRRGYGSTHSQSLEKHFLGLPGTQVLALHHRHDPADLYGRLFATLDRPTLVVENKLLYGMKVAADPPAGFAWEQSDEPFPTTRLRPEARPDVTIVCYGGMLAEVEKAVLALFDEHEIVAEVICPQRLYPLNVAPILDAVRDSRRLLVVEEGHGFAAFGAEVVAELQERGPGLLTAVRRLAAPDHPLPSCRPLELDLLPDDRRVAAAAVEMVAHG